MEIRDSWISFLDQSACVSLLTGHLRLFVLKVNILGGLLFPLVLLVILVGDWLTLFLLLCEC